MARSRGTDAEEPRRRPKDDDETPRQKQRRGDDDEMDDDDDEDEGPVVPRKKRKSAKGPMRAVLTTIGSIAGAVALLLLLYWVYSPMGTDSRLLCYVPPEAVSLMGYDVADNAINPKMKEVHDLFINNYKRFKDPRFTTECGVDEKDVERYLSGVAMGDPKEEEKEPEQNKRGSFTIIRFKRDVDVEKFKASFKGRFRMDADEADGITFNKLTEIRPDATVPDISFYFPNDRTLIYTSTRKEMKEMLKRQKNRIELEGPLRELADKVDGQYFTCSKMPSFALRDSYSPRFGFSGNFVDKELNQNSPKYLSVGSATWFASNGNDILFANGELYADRVAAKEARFALNNGYYEARRGAFGEGGGVSGGDEVFFPKPAPGSFDSGNKEAKQAAQEAMVQYVKSYSVVRRGNFVAVSGMVSHEVFDKLWKGISQRFQPNPFGGMGGPPMPGGPGAPPMPGPPPPPR